MNTEIGDLCIAIAEDILAGDLGSSNGNTALNAIGYGLRSEIARAKFGKQFVPLKKKAA